MCISIVLFFHQFRCKLQDCGELRTLGSLEKQRTDWMDASGDLKRAKDYGNVVNKPMFASTPETLVLDILPPPELHLLIGPVNTIFSAMAKEWPGAAEWAVACHVQKEDYHGGSFNGNACRALLLKSDLLRSMCPFFCLKYVEVFRAFKCVVDSCYGTELSADFEDRIHEFRHAFNALEINVTPKIHAVFHHIPQFCLKYATGLGRHSEQASESVHAHFKSTWAKYKVNQSHPDYAARLLRAVKEFNCSHL